jgi:hypothetical protein
MAKKIKITSGRLLISLWIERIEKMQDELVFHGVDTSEEGNKAYELLDEARGWLYDFKRKQNLLKEMI